MTIPTRETLASTALRRHAATIAAGIAGASTLALLAGGSIAPLLAGASATPTIVWLRSLGANALASWLDQWVRTNLTSVLGDDLEAEQRLMEILTRDLQVQLAVNDSLAADVATLLERTAALPTVLDALHGQGGAQTRLLRLSVEDLRSSMFRNEQLRIVTLRAVAEQGESCAMLSSAATPHCWPRSGRCAPVILSRATRLAVIRSAAIR